MNDRFTFGTGLYHPYIDITDARWLRNALLFWDHIQTIVPSDVKRPYRQRDTKILQQEGYLSPLPCDLEGDLLNDLGRRVMSVIADPEGPFASKAGDSGEKQLIHVGKIGEILSDRFRMARLHPQKLSPELRALFSNAEADESNFLLVDADFADFYMSVLAARLARDLDLSPLSNERPAFEVNLRTMIDEVANRRASSAAGAIMTLTMESLVIDPAVPIEQLLNFRRQNLRLLENLAVELDKLGDQIKSAETVGDLRQKASRVYDRDVRPRLDSVKEALDDNFIGNIWGGLTTAATVSVGSAAPLASVVGLKGAVLIGAGAFLTMANFTVQSHFARRKVRRDSPFTYLAELEARFSLPKRLVQD